MLAHLYNEIELYIKANSPEKFLLLGNISMLLTQIYTQLKNSKKLNEYSKAHPLCVSNNIGE